MNKTPWILAVVAIVLVGTIAWFSMREDAEPTPAETPSVSSSPTGTPVAGVTPTPGSAKASPKPTTTGFIGLTGLKERASCTVGGSIEFLQPDLFSSKDAKITWKNVDIQSRQIHWKIAPNDGLVVGPNIFASLSVPNGSETLTVKLPAKPVTKSYKLTAAVTYGEMVNGNAVVKEAACTGSVDVRLKY